MRGASIKEHLAELEQVLKSLGFSDDTTRETRLIIVPNMFRARAFNFFPDMEHDALHLLRENKNIIILPAGKVICTDCEKCHLGQTGRKVITRMN